MTQNNVLEKVKCDFQGERVFQKNFTDATPETPFGTQLQTAAQSLSENSLAHTTEKVTRSAESELNTKLNWLRAAVLGANDGIVSIAGLVVGVYGAAVSNFALLVAGIAGLVAAALSMAAGEYVSVSTQRDAERAALAQQQRLILADPIAAEKRLSHFIQAQGISAALAQKTARELSGKDPLTAHARYELGIDANELTNPWHAAGASMAAFALGAIIPLLTIVLAPAAFAIPLTMFAVSLALALTGSISAYLGKAPILRATFRNVLWGNASMLITYLIGLLVGINIS